MKRKTRTIWALIGAALLFVAATTATAPSELPQTLSEQLAQIAARYGFAIKGLEKVEEMPARSVQGEIPQRLAKLLSEYNHVIIGSPQSGIERVIILSRKQPRPPLPNEVVVSTEQQGAHHFVEATLLGPNGAQLQLRLMVDTGATLVVLQDSKAKVLGFSTDNLETRKIQTANGQLTAKVGRLTSLRIGAESVAEVEVAFIEDNLLGENALLGMNVLSRYRMTLDDENDVMTLVRPD
jgi:aspartyl protease family protein